MGGYKVGLKSIDKKFCSPECKIHNRYGERPLRFIEGKKKVDEIVNNPLAKQRVKNAVIRICLRFNCFEYSEEILQDWYLSMMNGQKKKLLLSAMDTLERQLRHGFTDIGRNKVTFESLYHDNGTAKY